MGISTRIAAAATLFAATMTAIPAWAAEPPPEPAGGQPAINIPLPPGLAAIAKRALDALGTNVKAVQGGNGQAFNPTGVAVDGDGIAHTRMYRSYLGLPVLGGDMVVHQRSDGTWLGASLTLAEPPALSIVPKITAEAAKLALKSDVYTIFELPKLVIESRTADNKPRLAWQVRREGARKDGTPSIELVTVDALDGKTLMSEDEIQTAEGSGQSLYSGTVSLETNPAGGGFELKQMIMGGTWTGDAQNKDDCPVARVGPNQRCPVQLQQVTPPVLTDADNKWGDSTNRLTDQTSRQSLAVDAQYGNDMAWAFYKDVLNRNGIANDGKGSFNRAHFRTRWNNATWNGGLDARGQRQGCWCMSYGDGDGTNMGPVVGIDVAGHEMSHGVNYATAALTYNANDQGGLNEASSDILGTMIEYYANNAKDPFDYLLGEKVALPPLGKAFRYLDEPSKDGNSYDYWKPEFNNPANQAQGPYDNHFTSGVANHWFYLVSEGSGQKTINGETYNSPTVDGSTVQGIGNYEAVLIWYRALSTYMTSNTNYARAATCTIKAAADLFDPGSQQEKSVAAAWKAVNVTPDARPCVAR